MFHEIARTAVAERLFSREAGACVTGAGDVTSECVIMEMVVTQVMKEYFQNNSSLMDVIHGLRSQVLNAGRLSPVDWYLDYLDFTFHPSTGDLPAFALKPDALPRILTEIEPRRA